MSTRSAVLIRGVGRFGSGVSSVRVYQHSDGYPSWMLPELVEATKIAQRLVDEHVDNRPERFTDCPVPTVADMEAETFAGALMAASLTWYGMAARMDDDHDDDTRRAVYQGDYQDAHWGRQSDLEWMYLVDLPARAITVYASGGYDDPAAHLANGPVDPRRYALELSENYRGREYARISRAMQGLAAAGWTVAVPKGRKGKLTAKQHVDLRLAAVVKAGEEFKPAWRTEAVCGLLAGILADKAPSRIPVLVDALEDAGADDGELVGMLRSLADTTCS
jgi:hypothetical protein